MTNCIKQKNSIFDNKEEYEKTHAKRKNLESELEKYTKYSFYAKLVTYKEKQFLDFTDSNNQLKKIFFIPNIIDGSKYYLQLLGDIDKNTNKVDIDEKNVILRSTLIRDLNAPWTIDDVANHIFF